MIVSFKDSIKLFGVVIVCACATFVCTFFLNFYLDIIPLKDEIIPEILPLYEAQVSMAQFTCAITGGVLALIALIMLIFYIKLYIDAHMRNLGILKALGYSNVRLASNFWVFGLSVFLGCALGYAAGHIAMPFIYEQLTIDGMPEFSITYHPSLLAFLVIIPSVVFCAVACIYAYFTLSKPVGEMLRGEPSKVKNYKGKEQNDRPFLKEFCFKTLSAKKSLVFFVAFSCFCFSAMVQMGLSMDDLSSETMGLMILLIGVVLAAISMFMAVTSLINANIKNLAVMKAFGYNSKERAAGVLLGYVPFALLGFALGTVYQYGLLKIMVNILFKDVAEMPKYEFNVPVFFITVALFIAAYSLTMALYLISINKISVKEAILDN